MGSSNIKNVLTENRARNLRGEGRVLASYSEAIFCYESNIVFDSLINKKAKPYLIKRVASACLQSHVFSHLDIPCTYSLQISIQNFHNVHLYV